MIRSVAKNQSFRRTYWIAILAIGLSMIGSIAVGVTAYLAMQSVITRLQGDYIQNLTEVIATRLESRRAYYSSTEVREQMKDFVSNSWIEGVSLFDSSGQPLMFLESEDSVLSGLYRASKKSDRLELRHRKLLDDVLTTGTDVEPGPLEHGGVLYSWKRIRFAHGPPGWLLVSHATERESAGLASIAWLLGGLILVLSFLRAGVGFYLSRQARGYLTGVRGAAQHMVDTTHGIQNTVSYILHRAHEHKEGAEQQNESIRLTRASLEILLRSSQEITQTALVVVEQAKNNEMALEQVSETIRRLANQSHRIEEISEAIREIANKSELLALNASLEGARAGEAGRGFSLVANQLQRLTEGVTRSAEDIQKLTQRIAELTQASVQSSTEAKDYADQTTRSAQTIARIVSEQQQGTQELFGSLDHIGRLADTIARGSQDAHTHIQRIVLLSENIDECVEPYLSNVDSEEPAAVYDEAYLADVIDPVDFSEIDSSAA